MINTIATVTRVLLFVISLFAKKRTKSSESPQKRVVEDGSRLVSYYNQTLLIFSTKVEKILKELRDNTIMSLITEEEHREISEAARKVNKDVALTALGAFLLMHICILVSIVYFPPQYSGLMTAVTMIIGFRMVSNPCAISLWDIQSVFTGFVVTFIVNFAVNPADYLARGWKGALELVGLAWLGATFANIVFSSIPM